VYHENRLDELISGRAGRIDLAICDPLAEKDRRPPQGLIEIKGRNSSWPSFSAAFLRLCTIAEELKIPDVLIGLVCPTAPTQASGLDAEEATFKRMFLANFHDLAVVDLPRVSQRRQSVYGTPDAHDTWEVMSIFNHT